MRHARQCQKRPITVSKETRRPPQHCWPHDGDDVCLMLSCSDISLIVREQARVFRMYPPPHLKWTEMSGHLANRQRESTCERERGREGGEGGGGRARSSGRKVHQHPPDGYGGHTHGHWSSLHILHHKKYSPQAVRGLVTHISLSRRPLQHPPHRFQNSLSLSLQLSLPP